MTIETCLYLAALVVFFANPPDTSQLIIIANSARHGLRKSGCTIAGDLAPNVLQISLVVMSIWCIRNCSGETLRAS